MKIKLNVTLKIISCFVIMSFYNGSRYRTVNSCKSLLVDFPMW